MIEIQGIEARFGIFILKDIDLAIHEKECFVLAGPMGAGKTLFLETVLGVKPPCKGQIFLHGEDSYNKQDGYNIIPNGSWSFIREIGDVTEPTA